MKTTFNVKVCNDTDKKIDEKSKTWGTAYAPAPPPNKSFDTNLFIILLVAILASLVRVLRGEE